MCDRETATMRGCHLGYTDTLIIIIIIIIVYSQLIIHRDQTKTNNNTLTTKIHEKL